MAAKERTLERTATPGVYRRGKSYVVVYRFRGEQRKRFARTYEEARDLRSEPHTDIRRAEYREQERVTFETYACEWVETSTGRTTTGVRESTREGYRWSVERAIAFFGKRVPLLVHIEPRDVRAYVAWLFNVKQQGRELSAGTVRKHMATLRVRFATAVEDGLIRYNPAASVRVTRAGLPQKPDQKVRVLEADQLAAVLNAIDTEWRLFFELLAATGCRIGEALELRWGDVDFGAKRRGTLVVKGSGVRVPASALRLSKAGRS